MEILPEGALFRLVALLDVDIVHNNNISHKLRLAIPSNRGFYSPPQRPAAAHVGVYTLYTRNRAVRQHCHSK